MPAVGVAGRLRGLSRATRGWAAGAAVVLVAGVAVWVRVTSSDPASSAADAVTPTPAVAVDSTAAAIVDPGPPASQPAPTDTGFTGVYIGEEVVTAISGPHAVWFDVGTVLAPVTWTVTTQCASDRCTANVGTLTFTSIDGDSWASAPTVEADQCTGADGSPTGTAPMRVERALSVTSRDQGLVTGSRMDVVITELSPCPGNTETLTEHTSITFTRLS